MLLVVITSIASGVLGYKTGQGWGFYAVPLIVLGFRSLPAKRRERGISASAFLDDRIILIGHSAEFAHAWAATIAAPIDE